MARKANNKELTPTHDGFDETRLVEAGEATQELSMLMRAANENAIALAEQVGYTGSLNLEVLESGIAESQGRVAFELFAIGARLLLLKELCSHGEFADRCARVGFEGRVARRLMQATLRLGNRATSPDLERLGKSKLFELLVLDDDELDALTSGGSARGIVMDDADRMSVKELRAALREAKADAEATDRVLADNQKAITKLQKAAAGKKIDAHEEWSGAMKELALHVAGHRAQILESVTALDVIREKVMQQEAEPGAEAALAAAREQIGRELAEAVERTEELVSKVRRLFDCTLGALIG